MHTHAHSNAEQPPTPELAGLLRAEADRIQQRVECLSRNRDAILAYLAVVEASQKPES
ncbi:hypothetical protein ACQEVF_41720 [Nonomuraea polychroma]|uniref:hypothetical protein n=1 Tax=Nonomuraea polychroma TaxID=46176 RepID=UPI003D8F625B